MPVRVVMQYELPMGATGRIREMAEVVIDPDLGQVADADILVVGPQPVDAAFLDRAGERLKMVATPGIGVDKIDVAAAAERGIIVIHNPDAPTESTAEHAVALLMAMAARVMTGDRFLRGDDSIERIDMRGTELLGRTLGVLGYGRIGRRVAGICALGLGMEVVVHDPFVDPGSKMPDGVTLTDSFDAVFAGSTFVTLHVPLLPETRHLVSERELRLIPQGGYLVNASRGPVLDEAALIRVLKDGHLAGAALDVTDPEPPLPDNPLLSMKNVIVTPHIASGTDRGIHAMMHGVADQIGQVIGGEPPRSMVIPQAWPGRFAGWSPA
ncbi:MAG: hydroxyacid dehydrogenase [Alphaproteobacteria bacterium]|nr:hydroxyacid dehydrogenase [Alphaproteobacteria bacterium]